MPSLIHHSQATIVDDGPPFNMSDQHGKSSQHQPYSIKLNSKYVVTVTLVPLHESAKPTRSLVFAHIDGSEEVRIGRCSKREARKRIPASDNTWFDSRVMSRDHCVLVIDAKNKASFSCLYSYFVLTGWQSSHVCDVGSTHGTFLNDEKLMVGSDAPLFDGDIIRFGVNVDRGQGMYGSSGFEHESI